MFDLGRFLDRAFGSLCGFNSTSLRKLNFRDQLAIKILSVWGLAGIFVCAFSTGYLTFHATGFFWLAVLFFVFVAFLLISLQILLVTSSGMDLNIRPIDRKKWRPSIFRLITVLIIGIIFSQLIVFTLMGLTEQLNSNASIQDLNLQEEAISLRYNENILVKKLQKTKIQSIRNLIDENAPNVTSSYVKRALVLDDGESSNLINPLLENLKRLGFEITHLSKLHGADLEFKIKEYYSQLNTGDISIVVYRGTAKVSEDHSVVLTSENPTETTSEVYLDNLITIIKNKNPLNSYFLLSTSKFETNGIPLEFVKWPKQKDSFTAVLLNDINGALLHVFTDEISVTKELNNVIRNSIIRVRAKITDTQELQHSQYPFVPVFLTWRRGLFYEKHTKESLDQIIPKKDFCRVYLEFNQDMLSQCLQSEERILDSRIQFLNKMMKADIENIENLKSKKIFKPSIIFNYFSEILNHKLFTFFLTSISIFLVSGGIIIRDFLTSAMVRYESETNKFSRVSVHIAFKQYRQKLRNIRLDMLQTGEFFDNDSITHPLYKEHNPLKLTKNDIKNDEFYKLLLNQIQSSK